MGQYHIPVNIDKREFINPHVLNDGIKMLGWGQGGGTTIALTVLLSCSHMRGGGDLTANDPHALKVMGRWAGDRIVIVGDYTEAGDPGTDELFEMIRDQGGSNMHPWEWVHQMFTDISLACREVIRMDAYVAERIPETLPDYMEDAAKSSKCLSDLGWHNTPQEV